MTDRPIIFSAPMICALFAGRKTMTRRLAFRHQVICDPKNGHFLRNEYPPSRWMGVRQGDRLWVKETFFHYREKCKESSTGFVDWLHYRATDEDDFLPGMKWKPSVYMPRSASRLTLAVTATKIERLQQISYADTIAEGAPAVEVPGGPEPHIVPTDDKGTGCTGKSLRAWFHYDIWNALHGAESWEANPEVVAITFAVHKQNIDAMREAA